MESASEMENKYPVDVLSQFRFEIKKYFYNCHIFDSVSQNFYFIERYKIYKI